MSGGYADLTDGRVLAALYRLTGNTTAVPAERLARYLKAPEAEVLMRLRSLKRNRLAHEKRRKLEGRVWEPWS